MDQPRTIYVAGDYIAEQHIDTLIAHAEHVHTGLKSERMKDLTSEGTEDVPFEEVPVYCTYLDVEAIRHAGIWTPADIQEQLEQASEKDAKTFVAFLRNMEKKTYLNFHGDNKRKV